MKEFFPNTLLVFRPAGPMGGMAQQPDNMEIHYGRFLEESIYFSNQSFSETHLKKMTFHQTAFKHICMYTERRRSQRCVQGGTGYP